MNQAAKVLGVTPKTVRDWCQSGKLPAIPRSYGTKLTFQISSQAVDLMVATMRREAESQHHVSKQAAKDHADMLPFWIAAMERGLIAGKVFSPRTIKIYSFYALPFIDRYKCLSVETLKRELMNIDPKAFCKRLKLYEALVCFGKFLIREGCLDADFPDQVKGMRPRRHIPPKKFTVSEDGIKSLLSVSSSPMDRALLLLLSSTGLRASECCSLKIQDVDLSEGVLLVRLAKGGKTRRVGLSEPTVQALQDYLSPRSSTRPEASLFLNKRGFTLSRHGLYQRLERIGKVAGVTVSPHALRRAFVTINANKGRSLVMLQMACGHSDIKTTRGYCLTAEQEVIDAMKSWD